MLPIFYACPGVDIELPAVRRRADLRRRVLTPKECDELGRVSGLSEEDDVLLRFSMKEAVYKAAHPLLRRTLGFKDVSRARVYAYVLSSRKNVGVRRVMCSTNADRPVPFSCGFNLYAHIANISLRTAAAGNILCTA